ncbi:DNA polymerase theta-like isoform X1 [Daphnia magna]|uniref:DNA polymerase theta-like isoform X1 n=1 Tax=Daphnia magna TaxID=35525 RepID=UPI001E1BCADE|nr:DNA polymerase theta-like isoform X1 [Daphnia magna]
MAVCCLLNWALMLELRILAHLSEDAGLCSVLSQPDGDVFRGIVSVWKKKKQEEVRDDERQKAKQICYGIVYGMGCKCLAEQLEVGEEEAQLFVNTFHATYPSIQSFITNTGQPMWKKIQEENELSC